ncbi:MAG: hypothetical protein HYT62_01555 [Candidatus Yanofskybacteria bacterium]|nr:hypothetical protein [Candidatus Yanofskybacteria bacterium]
MGTAFTIRQLSSEKSVSSADDQSLILPTRRDAVLVKINKFRTENLKVRQSDESQYLAKKVDSLFLKLCLSKLGLSRGQLAQLEPQELEEVAAVVYQQSRPVAISHACILACIPIAGWIILTASLLNSRQPDLDFWVNMRYYFWYRRMKNKYGQDFKPQPVNQYY